MPFFLFFFLFLCIGIFCGLAIESNPGVLINASKSLDGVSLLKTKRLEREVIENAIEDIAKGTWPQRRSAFDVLFGGHPVELDTYEADLEELRKKRNSVGHAFGRDIDKARRFEEIKPLPLDGIRQEKLIHFFDITLRVASAIDQYLFLLEFYFWHRTTTKTTNTLCPIKYTNIESLFTVECANLIMVVEIRRYSFQIGRLERNLIYLS